MLLSPVGRRGPWAVLLGPCSGDLRFLSLGLDLVFLALPPPTLFSAPVGGSPFLFRAAFGFGLAPCHPTRWHPLWPCLCGSGSWRLALRFQQRESLTVARVEQSWCILSLSKRLQIGFKAWETVLQRGRKALTPYRWEAGDAHGYFILCPEVRFGAGEFSCAWELTPDLREPTGLSCRSGRARPTRRSP